MSKAHRHIVNLLTINIKFFLLFQLCDVATFVLINRSKDEVFIIILAVLLTELSKFC